MRNDLPILVSHFYLLRDERKGEENAHVEWRKKRGRNDSDTNGIGLLSIKYKVDEELIIGLQLFISLFSVETIVDKTNKVGKSKQKDIPYGLMSWQKKANIYKTESHKVNAIAGIFKAFEVI